MVRAGYPLQFMTCRCSKRLYEMSVEQKVLLLSLLLRKKRKQRRRVWVHPITSARLTEGCHCLLFKELEDDPIKFFNYFRMSRQTFYELLSLLEESIKKQEPRPPSTAVQPALQTAAGNPPQTRSSDIARRVARGSFKWGQASYPPRPGG